MSRRKTMNAEPNDPALGDVLVSADRLQRRIQGLAAAIAPTYAGRRPVLVAVMQGSAVFLADLVRAWPEPVDTVQVAAESYDGTRPGRVRLTLPPDLRRQVAGRPVLVVDDIHDTGGTLSEVCRALEALGPADLRSVVLFLKHRAGGPLAGRSPDWVGFEIPDHFVVGYGLDYRGRYRDLPYLAVFRPVENGR